MKMKYLILGANGLIGQRFVRLCEDKKIDYAGTRYSREGDGLIRFNLLEFDKIHEIFNRVSPDVVVNSTGLAGGVNFCQQNPEAGRQYHVESNKIMVDWCKEHHAAYVYISTDYVFDGTNPPYKEDDPPNPLNLYGKYKREGEEYIQKQLEKHVIARTTNVFGWDPLTQTPNFLMHLVNTLKEQDSMKVPGFLFGNPTHAGDLAAGIMDLLENNHYGLYHIVGPGYINRCDWAAKFVEMAGLTGKTLEKITVPPAGMVPRPLTSNLDTAKFREKSNLHMLDIDEGLKRFIDAMKQE